MPAFCRAHRPRGAVACVFCNEPTAHTRLEEEIFYPWLRENLGAEASDLVEEALVEHASRGRPFI